MFLVSTKVEARIEFDSLKMVNADIIRLIFSFNTIKKFKMYVHQSKTFENLKI
jgi:hypothetical protein